MSLDFPASGNALWALSDATGIRPEYILPVLYSESGFNPAATNSINCQGINQLCQNIPSDYNTWAASQQLTGSVTPYMKNIVSTYGPLASAAKVYQANFLPSTLRTATSLDSVIAQKGSSRTVPQSSLTEATVYSANPGLDANGDGFITVDDLATKTRAALAASAVQSAIAQTYALRPNESPVPDPAYGTDFSSGPLSTLDYVLIAAATAAAGAVAYTVYTHGAIR